MRRTRRIAIVGIDGSGKSTIVRRLVERSRLDPGERVVLHCPLYHLVPGAPLGGLSRRLDCFSRSADALGDFPLKAAALFLQMTLFGPVERFLVETFRPRVLFSERHALVDALAYGPFYRQMTAAAPDRERIEEPLSRLLDAEFPGALEEIDGWVRVLCARLGVQVTLWQLPLVVREFFALPLHEAVAQLGGWFETGLPDVVVLLDPGGAAAAGRVAGRDGGAPQELHETASHLEALRLGYHRLLDSLARSFEDLRTFVVETGEGKSIDESLDEVLAALHA